MIKWIHPTFKNDVVTAFNDKTEYIGCINFHTRVIFLNSRDLTRGMRENLIQACFGLSKHHIGMIEQDDTVSDMKSQLPLGVVVGRQMRKYANTLVQRLKMNFEAALKMLFECSDAQKLIESILGVVEIRGPGLDLSMRTMLSLGSTKLTIVLSKGICLLLVTSRVRF